ncbi:MAG: peptidoglycan editing factor PgeF [Thiovulaceae bacterium]|nr:peptidoglycan editing factor PgeF [Sulfurimonadaceae bacterium]
MQKIKLFKPFSQLQALFSLRHGGVSQEPFSSLNLAFHVDDEEADVLANRELLKKAFSEDVTLHAMQQVHGKEVCHVDSEVLKPTCDALITDKPNQLLMVMVADCIPILFFDPVHKAIAAIHAGRAGAFGNIVKQTALKMADAFGTESKDLLVALGPSIHNCCYEVGLEVVDEAKGLGYEYALTKRDNSQFLNIQTIVERQLKSLGITDENLEISQICTACESQDYFSYRKEGKTGRFCGGIMLK